MTYPRAHLVDQKNGGYFHCTSRCVRQSWLCGADKVSGRSYEHRRKWIGKRIEFLASLFAVDIYAFAIMSNHYHIVLRLDPKRTENWSDSEVVERWLKRHGQYKRDKATLERMQLVLAQPEKIREIRNRLGSLSWFMRHINEPLARQANKEDECSGRFWEGRFKSIALLDQTALLACMVYVDLNPARANSSLRLPSHHTSARARSRKETSALAPLELLGTNTSEYLELLRWTRAKKVSGRKPLASKPSLLRKVRQSEADWRSWVKAYSHWYRAYGLANSLKKYAAQICQRWIQIPELRKLQST